MNPPADRRTVSTSIPQRQSEGRAETRRLFIAIELPEAWKQALQALQDRMQAALTTDPRTKGVRVRWVRPEGIHLTLKFLGEVPAGRLDAIERALASAVPQAPGFQLALFSVGSFSDRRAPRVIWAGIAETPPGSQQAQHTELFRLVEQVETWLAAAGFPRERRSFAPHLTLARLPEDLSPPLREAVAAVTNAFNASDAPAFTVDRVSLMRSHLGPGGARYERLSAYPPV